MIRDIINIIARVSVIYCLSQALFQHYHTAKQIAEVQDARSVAALLLYELVWLVLGIFMLLLVVLT